MDHQPHFVPDMGIGGAGKWPKDKEGHSKDLAAGPVKAACLSCRQKKAKCDGAKPVCGQCDRKQLECIYIKSKRGGARKKRDPAAPSALSEFLKKLDSLMGVPQFDLRHAEPQPGDDPTNIVRTFSSREEVFRCYYNEVHPFLAVMPPRHYLVDVLPTLLPQSPFLLAAQTVMTLAPHPLDPNPRSTRSKRLRSSASAALGRKAREAIQRSLNTAPNLEVVQALTILSVWEWGSTNNASASMELSRQAVNVAISMGMHDMDSNGTGFALEGIDWRRDSMRRSWWILYVYQLTAGLVSGLTPPLGADDPSIKVDFPVCSDKDRTWSTWINCIRQCVRVVNMINVVAASEGAGNESGMKGWGNAADGAAPLTPEQQDHNRRQMLVIDRQIMELMKETEKMSTVEQVPGGEEDVVRNQQIATRFGLAVIHIHQHRATAFPEVSLFSKRICGLKSTSEEDESGGEESFAGTSTPQSVPPGNSQSTSSQSQAQAQLAQQQMFQMPSMPGGWPLTGLDNFGMNDNNSTIPGGFDSTFGANQDVFQVNQMMASLGTQPGAVVPPRQQFNAQQVYPSPSPISQSQNGTAMSQMSTNSPQDLAQRNFSSLGNTATSSPGGAGGIDMRSSPSYNQSPVLPGANAPVAPFNPALANNWHYDLQNEAITGDMWQPESFPSYLPTPWFAQQGGAAALSVDPEVEPYHYPALEGTIDGSGLQDLTQLNVRGSYQSNLPSAATAMSQPPSATPQPPPKQSASLSGSQTSSISKKHKAWGVDENGDLAPSEDVKAAEQLETFPPGISLARCATAAHTIVRLEVLHRSAALALDGTPKWIPFCSCGLVSGAYAFLLLVLAVQAENTFGTYSEARNEEVEALLTNVKIILGGLEAYGTMWDGIDMMAREVRAAVEAATQLPLEVQSQISARSSMSPGVLESGR